MTQQERFESVCGFWPFCIPMHKYHDGGYRDSDAKRAWAIWQAACPEDWQENEQIIASSNLNDRDEIVIQQFLVDYNTHPTPDEFEQTGVNGYFQWWRAKRAATAKPPC